MIHSEQELIVLFSNFIKNGMGNKIQQHPGFSVPEQEVQNELPMPYMTLFYMGDELNLDSFLSGTKYYKQVGTGDDIQFEKWKMPEPVKFFFQLDIYSQSSKNLVQLTTKLSSVINRRGTTMLDNDGDPVAIEVTDVADFSRDSFRLEKSEERIFRRTYTYSLDCYFQPEENPIEVVGPVLSTELVFEIIKENNDD